MKKLLLLSGILTMLLFAKESAGAIHTEHARNFDLKAKSSAVTIDITVYLDVLGIPVPVNLALITNNATLATVLTNVLGIAPPLNANVGDIITISAPGQQPMTFVVPAAGPGGTQFAIYGGSGFYASANINSF